MVQIDYFLKNLFDFLVIFLSLCYLHEGLEHLFVLLCCLHEDITYAVLFICGNHFIAIFFWNLIFKNYLKIIDYFLLKKKAEDHYSGSEGNEEEKQKGFHQGILIRLDYKTGFCSMTILYYTNHQKEVFWTWEKFKPGDPSPFPES